MLTGILSSLHEVLELFRENKDVFADAGGELDDVLRVLTTKVRPRCVSRKVSLLGQSLAPLIKSGIANTPAYVSRTSRVGAEIRDFAGQAGAGPGHLRSIEIGD